MASRQSVSSILKPPKVRAPLKEIETVDQDADENTATLSKRKVSFSGMNKIKMYNTGATSLTVHQAPMFDEQISMLSDSSNAEKPKLSEKFEKSDTQISIESTNCTNLEDNGRIIIEYESPNDNMEMTEALSGKILSDTIYTIDNNGSKRISYSSDYSENNMEFTEALKVGQILSGDNSCDLSSTEMSETLVDESDEELVNQFGFIPSTPSSDVPYKNTSNISSNSSCMEFTCANTKSNLSCNTQSSNMELTCMTKSLKSIWSNDDYKSLSMELTQLPDRQTFEDNCELVYEYSEHSMSMGSDISYEIQEKSSCESENVQTKESERNNSNSQTTGCVLDNSRNGEDFIEELSLSMVSMDIDPTLEDNAFDISYVNIDEPLKVENEQKFSTISMTAAVENNSNSEQSVLENYSSIIDSNQNNESRLSILPTGSSFVLNMSPENNINKHVEVENLLQQTLYDHTSVLDKNQYLENKSIIVENNVPKKYSRKTMIYTCPLIVQDGSNENEDPSEIVKDNQQKRYSRKSIVPTTVFKDDVSDTNVVLEENQQEKYSRKSVTPSTVFNDDISESNVVLEENQQEKYSRKSVTPSTVFNDDISESNVVLEENQQEKYSRKSVAPSTTFINDVSGTNLVLEVNQQEKYSRKSIVPSTVFNDDISNTNVVLEENQQQNCSLQSIAMSVFNQNQSLGTQDVSNISVYNPSQFAEKFDTSKCLPTWSAEKEETSLYNSIQSAEKEEISLYNSSQSAEKEEISLCNSTQSMEKEDTSEIIKEYQLKNYSRKTIGPTSVVFTHSESLDDSMSNISLNTEESNKPKFDKTLDSEVPVSVDNQSILQSDVSIHNEEKLISKNKHQSVLLNMISDDNLNSPFRKKPKTSIVLTHSTNSPVKDQYIDNKLEIIDDISPENNVSKMDISIEHEFENDSIIQNSPEVLVVSNEGKKLDNIIVHDQMCETNIEKIVMEPSESEISKTNLNKLVKDNDIFKENEKINEENNKNNSIKVTDNISMTNHVLNSKSYSPSCCEDNTTKSICVNNINNITTDQTLQNNEKSCLVNRKRSYSNRDCAPLSCSSFMTKPNIYNNMDEDFNTDDFIQQSPIKNDVTNKSLANEQLEIGNELKESLIENESIKENLCNEVLEFLTRWNEQFIEKKLVLDKCTNKEWIFNVLDSHLILIITYSSISNNYSFLKVEDISFTSKSIAKNEIIKFGINWILSKYNPKVYKQICFTSRDVELLLKSLLGDVHYISKVMNNMSYVSDIYCVTFKDNKAQFVVHNMKCPLMVRIEITLSNIHKLSIKDLSVDCLFGNFNTKLLEEIMEDITKDHNVLQSLVETLIKFYSH